MTSPSIAPRDLVFLLDLHLGRIVTTRRVDSSGDNRIELKTILDCPELAEIRRLHRNLRNFAERLEIPCSDAFRAGMYLMPVSRLTEIDEFFANAQVRLDGLVDNLVGLYDRRKREARKRLGKLYNESDYPDEKSLRQTYVVQYSFITLVTPEGLRRSDNGIYEREAEKLRRQFDRAIEESKQILAREARDLAAKVVERLTTPRGGKPKIYRDSLLTNWDDYFELFDDKNITGDKELSSIVHGLKERIAGKGCSQLRNSVKLRREMKKVFTDVVERLDKMLD